MFVELPTSANNVTLLAFAAERRPCSNLVQYLVVAGPTAANYDEAAVTEMTDRQTDV